jgi:hypothetical protein
MKRVWVVCALVGLALAGPLRADEPKKPEGKTTQVPYRMTNFNHVMVRAKINGQGPFNFIVDTGAPALFVATAVADKIGVKPDKKGWGTFEKFEIEGGVVIENAKGRIETPFQLEGMNGMGLAGAELHGMIGYNLLAKFRIEYDFTRSKMAWTELAFDPPPPESIGGKGGSGGLELIGTLMKALGGFMGTKPNPDLAARPFLGLELSEDGKGTVTVKSVLAAGPSGKAGIKTGDKVLEFKGRSVRTIQDVSDYLSKKAKAGDDITLTVERDGTQKEIKVTLAEGL